MNSYAKLLSLAANEVRTFVKNNRPAQPPTSQWESLERTIDAASTQETDETAEQLMTGIARHLVDEFPLNQQFPVSFWKAMDALEKKKRQMRRTSGSSVRSARGGPRVR